MTAAVANPRRIEPEYRRTHEPIHRDSRLVGRVERTWWAPFDPKSKAAIMNALERHDQLSRLPGQRAAKGGMRRSRRTGQLVAHHGSTLVLPVMRELLRLVDYSTGRLEPSVKYLMGRLRRSKDAIVRALATLKAWGFLDWIRRFEPTGEDGLRGPQVRQIANAYRIILPKWAHKLLGRAFEPAPMPEDEEVRRKAMVKALRDYAVDDPDDPGGELGRTLARLERLLTGGRESSGQDESGLG